MAYDEISRTLTVSEANSLIKGVLDESFYQIVVKGEISGFRPSPSGHAYFDLKDVNAALPSVIFKSSLYSMPSFRNGDMVVALLDDSATVKTFYKEKDHIRLQPENHTMEPIIVPNCKILGKVAGVFRKM